MKTITLIGAGAVGQSLALSLHKSSKKIEGIYSEYGRSAKLLANKVKASISGSLTKERRLGQIVIIAVPDVRINDVVDTIVSQETTLKGKIFLHTSGALTSDELSALRKKGAAVGSFHPLQTFPKGLKHSSLKNIWFALEGDAAAVTAGKSLAAALGAKYFFVPKKDKTLYHIAAVFASNYQVTLFSVVEQLAAAVKIPQRHLWSIFRPLIAETLENVFSSSPVDALTGPIARGDYKTISKHFSTLESTPKLKHLVPLYSTLGIETAKLAKRKSNAR